MNLETSKSLLQLYDFNVIFVDWSAGSKTINYWAARARIRDVARVVSFFISKFFYSVNEWFKLKYEKKSRDILGVIISTALYTFSEISANFSL